MSQAIEAVSPSPGPAAAGPIQADWELDYYSRPILESDGKKRWELLICSSPLAGSAGSLATAFRWSLNCPASSVNSAWLRQSLEEALAEGIVTGHEQMPQFAFEPEQVTAIVAYLDTLKAQ